MAAFKSFAPVPVSGIWVEHALLMAFLLVASAILFVTRSESSFPVAIKAFHYLDVPWFIVLTLLLALLLNGEIKSHRCSSQCIFKSLYHNNISGLLPQCDANETGLFC